MDKGIRIYPKDAKQASLLKALFTEMGVEFEDDLHSSNIVAGEQVDYFKTEITEEEEIKKAFGAFESDKTADQIIKEIRDSRVSIREIELF